MGRQHPLYGLASRHTLFREIYCIAKGERPFCSFSVQRHTIFWGKTCIATSNIVTFLAISCRDTPFSPKNHVSRTAFLHSDNFSLGNTPFSARFLVSRQTTNKKLQGWSALESVLIVYVPLAVELTENLEVWLAITDGHLVYCLVYLVILISVECHHVVVLWEGLYQCSCWRKDHLIITL